MTRHELVQECDQEVERVLPEVPRPEQKALAAAVSGVVLAARAQVSRAGAPARACRPPGLGAGAGHLVDGRARPTGAAPRWARAAGRAVPSLLQHVSTGLRYLRRCLATDHPVPVTFHPLPESRAPLKLS